MINQEDTDDFGRVDTTGKGARMSCPNCGTTDITAKDWEGESQGASCKVKCEQCEWRWMEYYKADYWEAS